MLPFVMVVTGSNGGGGLKLRAFVLMPAVLFCQASIISSEFKKIKQLSGIPAINPADNFLL